MNFTTAIPEQYIESQMELGRFYETIVDERTNEFQSVAQDIKKDFRLTRVENTKQLLIFEFEKYCLQVEPTNAWYIEKAGDNVKNTLRYGFDNFQMAVGQPKAIELYTSLSRKNLNGNQSLKQ